MREIEANWCSSSGVRILQSRNYRLTRVMSAIGEEVETPRPRPLSGGLWTLFSWLRRDERSSSESLSSVGSDRTVASFAFLAPPPQRNKTVPFTPPILPTDSYKKRVRDRNLRRQYDRDLTLHRKYGLFRGDSGYDALSLPSARKVLDTTTDRQDRERRAISESLQRRAAYVPGKRRAPLPPGRPHSVSSSASLTRRHARKRPAPQPPGRVEDKMKENNEAHDQDIRDNINVEMNTASSRPRRPLSNDNPLECRAEKCSKKDNKSKETKTRPEKSFLKQIFDYKKRNSTIETVPERLLPSISELDKQAAEIIESLKSKERSNNPDNNSPPLNGDTWFCTKCLRKYSSTVINCLHCFPGSTRNETISTSGRVSGVGDDERQKLKELLKEMKNSLPKRPKHENALDKNITSSETATLRIGSTMLENKVVSEPQPSSSKQTVSSITLLPKTEKVLYDVQQQQKQFPVITEHVVLVAPQSNDKATNNVGVQNISKTNNDINSKAQPDIPSNNNNMAKEFISESQRNYLQTPLKISSLLNPVYIPKSTVSRDQSSRSLFFSQAETNNIKTQTNLTTKPSLLKHSSEEGNVRRKILEPSLPCNAELSSTRVKPLTRIDDGKERTNDVKTETKLAKQHTFLPKQDIPTTSFKVVDSIKTTPSHEINLIDEKGNRDLRQESSNKETKPLLSITKIDFGNAKQKSLPTIEDKSTTTSNTPKSDSKMINSNLIRMSVDQHSRRRDLINQLEQSIAKGDELAAAEAAAKLAQLRLACSVLSFSSQIVGESSKTTHHLEQMKKSVPIKTTNIKLDVSSGQSSTKANTGVQSSAVVSKNIKDVKLKVEKAVSTRNEVQKSQSNSALGSKPLENAASSKTEYNITSPKSVFTESQPSSSKQALDENTIASIEVWVEDREATRGPVRLRIPRQAMMGELRQQAEVSLGLASRLQRWIVGRTLCSDDNTPLVNLAGPDLTAPFYLCVVESETFGDPLRIKPESSTKTNIDIIKSQIDANKVSEVYTELMQLEQRALVYNTEHFECEICMEECVAGGGVVLRECVHSFCRECLLDLVKHCEEPVITCPAVGCRGILQEREIRALVSAEEYERWLARGLAAAENGTRNAFHCRTRDCSGWALCDPGVRKFPCPVCKRNNCVPCQAIHEGDTCEQYQTRLRETSLASDTNQTDAGTKALLDTLITKGEALQCPECSAIITKKWGCDWVKCSACKTEICWVTRGRRWGPGGRGDTSGGCRCGVDGKRCHPSCGYCH